MFCVSIYITSWVQIFYIVRDNKPCKNIGATTTNISLESSLSFEAYKVQRHINIMYTDSILYKINGVASFQHACIISYFVVNC